jgi:hypothetical protein
LGTSPACARWWRRRARAIALLEEASSHFAASPARLEFARCRTELGARRRANGERRAARAILRDAHDAAHASRALAMVTAKCRELRPPTSA